MVWREVLSQGPLFYNIDSELFWEMRAQFMETAYDVKLSEYKRKVLQEFHKLRRYTGGEIVLWFEYDVFCQINMIALLSYLLKMKRRSTISIINVGDHPDFDKKVGLGELNADQYPELFKNRRTLNQDDLRTADKAWMAFCGMTIDSFNEKKLDSFPYLNEALVASKKITSSSENLSELEMEIVDVIKTGSYSDDEIVKTLLTKDNILGFGDLQYKYLINKLRNS